MTPPATPPRRGQPIAALCLLMCAWVGMRGWYLMAEDNAPPAIHEGAAPLRGQAVALRSAPSPLAAVEVRSTRPRPVHRPALSRIATLGRSPSNPATGRVLPDLAFRLLPPGAADGPSDTPGGVTAQPATAASPSPLASRWSGDGWLLLRAAGGTAAQASGAASYGASQAGAVVRYRLGQDRDTGAYAYLRGSTAIGAPFRDRQLALGLGVRPVAALPLRILGEARLQETGQGRTLYRPAVTAVTELPRSDLPLGFRGEAYGQAGYVGGAGATPFFDAQVVVDRAVVRSRDSGLEARLGAGLWSGGQRGAARLDLGPRASLRLDPVLGVPTLLALDWRIRCAGDARPDSGPAMTLATSF